MSKSVRPAAAIVADEAPRAPRSNVIPFPVRAPAAHPYYGPADRDPLATPELEPHSGALCDLAYTIANVVTGYDDTDTSDRVGEARHERVYAETLDMLCKLTPTLVDGMRQLFPRSAV